jgi:hypothetical protein
LLPASIDWPLLAAPSIFSNVFDAININCNILFCIFQVDYNYSRDFWSLSSEPNRKDYSSYKLSDKILFQPMISGKINWFVHFTIQYLSLFSMGANKYEWKYKIVESGVKHHKPSQLFG